MIPLQIMTRPTCVPAADAFAGVLIWGIIWPVKLSSIYAKVMEKDHYTECSKPTPTTPKKSSPRG